jgi:hypothetical protein
VSAGVNGGWCAQPSFDTAAKSADGRFALHGSLGCQPEYGGSAILGFSGFETDQFAAAE